MPEWKYIARRMHHLLANDSGFTQQLLTLALADPSTTPSRSSSSIAPEQNMAKSVLLPTCTQQLAVSHN